MRYVVLASDYDGTLAHDGAVPEEIVHALERFRQSGRKLILLTGRVLADLQSVFPRSDLFDCIVAENGAVLYKPGTHESQVLAPPPKQSFLDALKQRGVPIGVGDAIVATWHPQETAVLEIIRDLGLELQVIFNKGAVMVLPSGINKRSGLDAALDVLGISEHNVVGVGDAENDHAFLEFCECSVAVANAHPAVKDTADFTTKADHGTGAEELIEMILKDDLAEQCPPRRAIPVGREGKSYICVPAYGSSLLVSGASASGKSTLTAGLLEILIERRYQVCLIDPEGDYEGFLGTVTVGDEKHPPAIDEILQILQKRASQIIVNLIGIAVAERPAFFARLLPPPPGDAPANRSAALDHYRRGAPSADARLGAGFGGVGRRTEEHGADHGPSRPHRGRGAQDSGWGVCSRARSRKGAGGFRQGCRNSEPRN